MVTIFGVLRRDLGNVTIQELPDRFDRFLQLMRTTNVKYTDHPPSEVTINRYIGCARTVCRYAAKMAAVTGVRGNPLSGFSCTTEQGRDRIWTTEEKERIFRTMTELGSYLYWPVYFCQWNPIRRGDLFKLTRDNLDRQNKRIHFYPSKTRGKVNRETYLPFIDTALWGYFDSLPADCPYLFPKLHEDGTWEQVRDPDTHWHTVLARTEVQDDGGKVVQAAVSDLHFHDVSKHVPISWMMDNGYSEVDIKALGIQYTHEMVMRYAHRDASAVADRWQASQAQVVGSIGIGVKVA
jgi:integrase